jgi:hypothetical protein
MRVEYATATSRSGSPFTGLAAAAGITVRDCELLASADRLISAVRLAEVRSRRDHPAGGGLGVAAAKVRLQQLRGRLQDEELREAGLL